MRACTTIALPCFAPHYAVEIVDNTTVVLVHEGDEVLLQGELMAAVAARLDGYRSAEAIAAALADRACPAEVYYILGWLQHKGYIIDASGVLVEAAGFWTSRAIDPAVARRKLAETPVAIESVGVADVSGLVEALCPWGIRIATSAACLLVLSDDYSRPELHAINQTCQDQGRPWMLVRSPGYLVWVGPAFVPGHTGCWQCLARQMAGNRPLHERVRASHGWRPPRRVTSGHFPAAQQITYALQALHIAQWIVQGQEAGVVGTVLTFDPAALHTETHRLARLPDCPVCGSVPAPTALTPRVELQSRRKVLYADAGQRSVQLEAMLQRCAPHVSWLTGTVRHVRQRTVLEGSGAYVYTGTYNRVRPAAQHQWHDSAWRSGCAGKGTTAMAARASAIGEAIERFSAQFHGNEARRWARLSELGACAIHPNQCMGFSPQQYAARDVWNAPGTRFRFVPEPFDAQAAMEWTPLWSLTHNEVRYLPTAYCYLFYPVADAGQCCVACTNGNAAGMTLEDAILQGFLELIERDAVALWWYNRIRRPQVPLDRFDSPALAQIGTFLDKIGREFWVLDLTADFNIPVCAAISRAVAGPEGISMGFGAHLDPTVALMRAVTEHMQTLAVVLPTHNQPGLNLEPISDPEARAWLIRATVAEHTYLVPNTGLPSHFLPHSCLPASDDVQEDIRYCQALVERRGMEMLVLEMTRPEVGIPVAKVVVPGLRHFWARFAPGRLYDVPVQLGWLTQPRTEPELNPVAMFL